MSAADLLARLDGVKQTSSTSWIARCPAHDDRSPSLSVRERDGGVVLINCFAECPKEDILSAIGLDWSALFPEQAAGDHIRPERRPFNPADILACSYREGLIVASIGSCMVRGEPITDRDYQRLITAVSRIGTAADLARGVS